MTALGAWDRLRAALEAAESLAIVVATYPRDDRAIGDALATFRALDQATLAATAHGGGGEGWEQAGAVVIESGTLLIHDIPESEIEQALTEYDARLEALSEGKQQVPFKGYVPSTDDQGVILWAFGGDGEFPVYIRRVPGELRIAEARIVFDMEGAEQ